MILAGHEFIDSLRLSKKLLLLVINTEYDIKGRYDNEDKETLSDQVIVTSANLLIVPVISSAPTDRVRKLSENSKCTTM